MSRMMDDCGSRRPPRPWAIRHRGHHVDQEFHHHLLPSLGGPYPIPSAVSKISGLTSTPSGRSCRGSPARATPWCRFCASSSCARTPPLEGDVKDMIAGQFDAAQTRFAAIGHGQHGDSRAGQPAIRRPAWLRLAGYPGACRWNLTARNDRRTSGPAARRRRASSAQGARSTGDRSDDLAGSVGTEDVDFAAPS